MGFSPSRRTRLRRGWTTELNYLPVRFGNDEQSTRSLKLQLLPLPGPSDSQTSGATRMAGEVKHLFVLMLENRSFDHMLGRCGVAGVEGVQAGMSNPGGPYGDVAINDDAPDTPPCDPHHEYPDAQMQIFGTRLPDPARLLLVPNYWRQPSFLQMPAYATRKQFQGRWRVPTSSSWQCDAAPLAWLES